MPCVRHAPQEEIGRVELALGVETREAQREAKEARRTLLELEIECDELRRAAGQQAKELSMEVDRQRKVRDCVDGGAPRARMVLRTRRPRRPR